MRVIAGEKSEPRSVVEYHGEAFDIGIQTPRNRANRGRESCFRVYVRMLPSTTIRQSLTGSKMACS